MKEIYSVTRITKEEEEEAIAMLTVFSQMTYSEFREDTNTDKFYKLFIILGIMCQRGNEKYLELRRKLKHIFLGAREYKYGTNTKIKEHQMNKVLYDYSIKTNVKPGRLKHMIIRKYVTDNFGVLLLGCPYRQTNAYEDTIKYGATIEVLEKYTPELFIKCLQTYELFDAEKF